jgi:hypothetical protein
MEYYNYRVQYFEKYWGRTNQLWYRGYNLDNYHCGLWETYHPDGIEMDKEYYAR